MTKEAVAVYSTNRPAAFKPVAPYATPSETIDLVSESCTGELETFTVAHGRSGPETGIALVRLEDGRRAIANASPAGLAILREDASPIGRAVSVTVEGEQGTFDFV